MAGKRPWGARVFAATAVVVLALLAGRAGIPAGRVEAKAAARAVLTAVHPPASHAVPARPALQPDGGIPGRPGTVAAVVVLLVLCTVVVRRTRVGSAAPGSLRWVRGPPVAGRPA